MSNSADLMGCSRPGFPVLFWSPGVCSKSCSLSLWSYLTISSSVIPFSSCLQSFPESGSFPMSWLFVSGGQNIGASASASVLPRIVKVDFLQDWLIWSLCCPRVLTWFCFIKIQWDFKTLSLHVIASYLKNYYFILIFIVWATVANLATLETWCTWKYSPLHYRTHSYRWSLKNWANRQATV